MLRRYQLLKRMLADMGIEDQRVRLEWISAAEGEKVKRVINEMTQHIQALGPLGFPGKVADWDREMTRLEDQVATATAAGCACGTHDPMEPAKQEVAHV
jgi:F420-non-reducing hydrogenase iron-sulfur subunit